MPVGASSKRCTPVPAPLQHLGVTLGAGPVRCCRHPPCGHPARPPHHPPGTHSFSRARSPRKEPFSSTVILLLLSSLREEQRERGSPVTPPAPSTRGAGRVLGMARLGSPGCATEVVVATVKSQGPTCMAGWGHKMQQPHWDVMPWSTYTAAAGWRCPGPCRLMGHLSCARAWVRGAAHGGDEMPPAPKPRAPKDLQPGRFPTAPPALAPYQPEHPSVTASRSLPAQWFYPKISSFGGTQGPL